jgi:hypothetical protein
LTIQETREEENLRRQIAKLKADERVLREKRQESEARLRRLVWNRLMRRVETLEAAPDHRGC